MIGGTRKVFEMALEHAKTRIAYERPIGAYQAVSYRIVDIKWELESMEALVYGVAWKLDNGLATDADVAGVKAFCGPAYERACTRSHNVLAGIGYLIEHPLHLYTRRAKVLDMWLGDSRSHLETVFESMGI
jgi:alkylation response protein AidB-like acyl-CoA dehydrogenase